MVATSAEYMHKLETIQTIEVITDAARRSVQILRNPRCVIQIDRDGTNPGNCNVAIRSPRANYPVLIGVIGAPQT